MIHGAYSAWRGVSAHAATDWRTEHSLKHLSFAPVRRAQTLEIDAVEHLILIPNYLEPLSILRETLRILASHPLALAAYHPVVAVEARERGSAEKAGELVAEFKDMFRGIGYTVHPEGIKGEAMGKSSNLAWALRKFWQEMKDAGLSLRAKNMVVTVFDSDSQYRPLTT